MRAQRHGKQTSRLTAGAGRRRLGGEKMPYIIQFLDKPDYGHVRAQWRPQHLEYLDANKDKLLAAGSLLNDDGSGGHGGIIIVDTDDRGEAENFIANDPYSQAGLFETVNVTRWRKAFYNFERLVP